MRIDSSGKVGIGTTAPDDYYSDNLVVSAPSEGGITIASTNTANGNYLCFADGTSGDARYRGLVGYNHNVDSLLFQTAGAERMRINSDGNVLVGKTAANSATVGCEARGDGRLFATAANSYSAFFNRTSSHGSLVIYAKDDVTVGSISTNANSLPSDRNFKRDIEDLNIGLDLITKLKPVSYNYKIDEDDCPKMFGLIAQDLEQSLEEVGVDKNSVQLLQHKPNEDEKESDYALDYLKLTPLLVKAIQELTTKLEAAEARITTLEG